MSKSRLLGLFPEVSLTADAIDQLHQLGVPDEKITIMSSVPYRPEMFGRPHPKGKVGLVSLIGALLGLSTGLFLTVGTFLLYPIEQGGQPIVPIPPSLIILFELTMLGTMWATFFGLLMANRFPITTAPLYDPRITEGHIGVVAEVDDALAEQVEKILQANGAQHVKRVEAVARRDVRRLIFWATLSGAVVVGAIVITLLAFSIIDIAIPTNMADQDSIAPQMGPRLAAPPGAVPIQGPVLIDDQPATAPNAATANSLQRGKVLFDTHCALCHGQNGTGDGPIGKYFAPKKPTDLTSDKIQKLSEADIFLVITNGFDPMPSLAENLDPGERWDVINYVRTFKKK